MMIVIVMRSLCLPAQVQFYQQVCVQLPTSADNATLLVFAAERRTCSSRSISPGSRAHSVEAAAATCGSQMMGRKNGRTGRRFHRPCSAYYVSSANKSLTVTVSYLGPNARHRQGGISDTAIRPSVRVSVPGRNGPRRAAALGYSHRRPPEMCGLRTRPRKDVDPPRVDPASAGGMSSRRPRGDTAFSFPFIVFGDRKAGINSVSTDRRP